MPMGQDDPLGVFSAKTICTNDLSLVSKGREGQLPLGPSTQCPPQL